MTGRAIGRRSASGTTAGRMSLVAALLLLALALPTSLAASAGAAAVAEPRQPPDVVGTTLDQARSRIEQEWYPGFTPTVLLTPDVPEQVAPEGVVVVAQEVVQYRENSDDVTPSAVIRLTVGSVVADLVGRTRDEAQALVDALGLSLKPTGEGLVTSQDPPAGVLVPFGSTVVATLEPPPSTGRTVPDVRGLTEADARAAVEGVDLVLRVGEAGGEGQRTVSQQDPRPGTVVDAGTAVTVTLTGTPPTASGVEVPDVTGLDPDGVQRVLEAAGLVLVVDPSGEPQGLAFRQDPSPGKRVAPGSTVTVAFAVVDAGTSPAAVLVGAAGAVLLAVVVLALWLLRSSGRPPTRPAPPAEVTVRPSADPSPRVAVEQGDPEHDLVLQVVPCADLGRLTVTEEGL